MSKVQRGSGMREGIIESNVEPLWKLLTDWGNLDWWGNDVAEEEMKAGRAYLEGEKGKVPRTKVIERSNADGAGLPVVNRETLIHEDHLAHRLYYNASDGFLLGVRNYLASWHVDPMSEDRCRMTITSTFDVVDPGNVDAVRNTVEAVYDAIFDGLNKYLAKRRTVA
ncbi:SRPBCC family protein [Trinickia symbiotica]|nr:SRPBCC family protein [Trinickia symbiotica]